MPNYVYHELTVYGNKAELDKFKQAVKYNIKTEDNNGFDFNGIEPMPEELNIEYSSAGNCAVELINSNKDELVKGTKFERLCNNIIKIDDKTTIQDLIDFLSINKNIDKFNAIDLDLGYQYIKNKEKYGHENWYEWRISNWGTKWNAVDVNCLESNDTHLTVEFLTAWSTPEPIFKRMIEKFPNLIFSGCFVEESKAFAGEINTVDGELEFMTVYDDDDYIENISINFFDDSEFED